MFDYDINFRVNSLTEYENELDKINNAILQINNDSFLSPHDKNLLVEELQGTFFFKNHDDSTLISAVVLKLSDGKMSFKHGFWRGRKYYEKDEWINSINELERKNG